MRMKLMHITPELAHEWLSKNTNNRSVREGHVHAIARDIVAGKWKVTGDVFRINTNGGLDDGQHRLLAIILAGKGVDSWVCFDCDPKIRSLIDQNKARSARDVFALKGYKNSCNLAALARAAFFLDAGKDPYSGIDRQTTRSEEESVVKKYPSLVEWAERSRQFPTQRVIITLVCWAFSLSSPRKVEEFAKQVAEAENISRKDPAWHLVQYLRRGEKQHRLKQYHVLGMAWAAMSAHINSEEVKVLKPSTEFRIPQ